MTKTIPLVEGNIVIDDQVGGPTIRLDTPAWFAWLEAPTTTRFSYALFNRNCGYIDGFMTVRKERRQRATIYWTVYRRQGHHLRKVYVGPSAALTQARLEQIAERLRPRAGPLPNPHFFVDDPPFVSWLEQPTHSAQVVRVRSSVRQQAKTRKSNCHPCTFLIDIESLIRNRRRIRATKAFEAVLGIVIHLAHRLLGGSLYPPHVLPP